jgi:hypothetical protein
MHLIDYQYFEDYSTHLKNTVMHDLKAIYNDVLDSVNEVAKEYFDEHGNSRFYPNKPKLSDLQIVALAMTSECAQIDSENLLWSKLNKDYKNLFRDLPHRTRFNKRRRLLADLITSIKARFSDVLYENYPDATLIVDSMPLPVCRIVRERSSKVCRNPQRDEVMASKGRNLIMNGWYIGYKLHLITTSTGIYRDMMITPANVHDNYFLKLITSEDEHLQGHELLGDRGYLGKATQLRLFEEAQIRLDVPYRRNQKDYRKYDQVKKIKRKQIEVVFSQLCDEFVIRRNYAKSFEGLYSRIVSKLAAKTFKQYWNMKNGRPLNQTKHALAA